MSAGQAGKKATRYGLRLACRKPIVVYEAKLELEALGAAANDLLLAELELCQSGKKNAVAVQCMSVAISLTQIAVTMTSFKGYGLVLFWIALLVLYCLIVALTVQEQTRQTRVLAFTLANLNDLRVINPLLKLWRPQCRRLSREPDRETCLELSRLLEIRCQSGETDRGASWLSLLPTRVTMHYPDSPGLWQSLTRSRKDLSEVESDLVATAVKALAASTNHKDRSLVRRIAATPASQPNRQFIQEIAAAFVADSFRGVRVAPPSSPPASLWISSPVTAPQPVFAVAARSGQWP